MGWFRFFGNTLRKIWNTERSMTKPNGKLVLRGSFILIVVVFSLTEINRGVGERNSSEIESEETSRVSQRASNKETNATLPNNSAEIKFTYEKRKGFRGHAANRTALISQQAVFTAAEELKKRIDLPFDIQVIFEECNDPDSYYNDDSHEITICYELIEAYDYLFSRTRDAELSEMTRQKVSSSQCFSMKSRTLSSMVGPSYYGPRGRRCGSVLNTAADQWNT
jgi:hypothetical protein